MKILVLADQKSKYLYDYYEPDKLKDIDLIISCGDLSPTYLSFFVTLCNVPLLYVRGNHDGRYMNRHRRKDVSALRMTFMCMKESAFWDWAALWNIYRKQAINILSRKCGDVYGN